MERHCQKQFIQIINIFLFLALILVTFFGVVQNNIQLKSQKNAHNHIRGQWDAMDPTNPHSAAHFGTYVFKPTSILSSIDDGINSVTGVVLRLEGHKQNDISYSESSQSLFISKFGKFKPSLLLQLIIPLFLILLSYNSYISEVTSSRMKLLLVQSKSIKNILWGKIFSVLSLGLILLMITIITQVIFSYELLKLDDIFRLFLMISSYMLYYFVLVSLTILISLKLKNSTTTLSFILIIWFFWTIFLPKLTWNVADKISPLTTRYELKKRMSEDRLMGIDGHNPFDQRKKELEDEVLNKYQVDSLSQLPINFAGIIMQADEEYGNIVWDKHYGSLYEKLENQKKYLQLSGLINPFKSLQNLSMASSGTDLYHHINFLKKAENYRRYFIKTLNDEYAYGGSKTGERGWKSSNEFFRSIKDFNYTRTKLYTLLKYYLLDLFSLILWATILCILIFKSSQKTLSK